MKKLLAIVVLGLLWCNLSFADDQAKRKELIDSLINKHNIFEKIEIPGTIPRVCKARSRPRQNQRYSDTIKDCRDIL